MNSTSRQPVPGVDIKAQLAATHNPLFPFSSPNLNEQSSIRSRRGDHAFQSRNPFESGVSTPSLTDDDGVTLSDRDDFHFENHSQDAQTLTRKMPSSTRIESTSSVGQKRRRPGLQIVTEFPKAPVRSGNIVFNEVQVKHPEQRRNHTLSVVSQKGVKGLPSPLHHRNPVEALSAIKNSITGRREKISNATAGSEAPRRKTPGKHAPSPTRSSVVFGLCVPESEASMHRQGDLLESAVTLVTPLTPKVIVTPADTEAALGSGLHANQGRERGFVEDSPSSIYSRAVSHFGRQARAQEVPPLPHVPARYNLQASTSKQSSAQQRQNESKLGAESQTLDRKMEYQVTWDNSEQILIDSADTARPKSQGWWNLILSPMLSRAGTLKSLAARRKDTIPPVPPLPADQEKTPPADTPMTDFSPETPRRLGLAGVRTSTWSRWTGWENERDMADESLSVYREPVPAIPEEHIPHDFISGGRPVAADTHKGEGLAAEYYHACAIEQLTNITYFECINHSCAEKLPKLCSIYDGHAEKVGAGGPHASNGDAGKSRRLLIEDLSQSGLGKTEPHALMNQKPAESVKIPAETDVSSEKSELVTPMETEIDVEEFVSPNVREARTAAFSKARAVNSRESSPMPVQASSQQPPAKATEDTARPVPLQAVVDSPGPMSPDANRVLAPREATPLAPVQSLPPGVGPTIAGPAPTVNHILMPQPQYPAPPQIVYFQKQSEPYLTASPQPLPYYMTQQRGHLEVQPGEVLRPAQDTQPTRLNEQDLQRPQSQEGPIEPQLMGWLAPIGFGPEDKSGGVIEHEEEQGENKEKKEKRGGILAGVCCLRRSPEDRPETVHRIRIILLSVALVLIVLLCILFALLFRRKGNVTPIQSQWLNLTGYPAVPTGISTIARPNLAASQNACVQPNTLWSCSVPKEDQAGISPNDPDQPDFRFQIRFRNGTVPSNLTTPLDRRAADSGANDLFVPNPAPPGQPDQIFLGNTTDNVTQPFDGETTPFFITFMNAVPGQSVDGSTRKRRVRQSSSQDALNSIPAPDIGPDGTAAPASLLPNAPLPISQPIKLYNRGLPDEHYGFYVYYDKSVFLSGIQLQNGTAINGSLIPAAADQDGGSAKKSARVRCTFAQTRFIMKMYTNPAFKATLLPSTSGDNSTSPNQAGNETSSATNFDRPGSFPYPTTIQLDRHGGDVNKKIAYCYGVDSNNQEIESGEKILVSEIRSFGGVLINPSPQLLQSNSTFDSSAGGIDGGTGGCGCTWQNWA